MDKLMQLHGGEVLLSNGGATILSRKNVLHPAAKMLVKCSISQDIEVGDGTTNDERRGIGGGVTRHLLGTPCQGDTSHGHRVELLHRFQGLHVGAVLESVKS
jgi:hypothetical protein